MELLGVGALGMGGSGNWGIGKDNGVIIWMNKRQFGRPIGQNNFTIHPNGRLFGCPITLPPPPQGLWEGPWGGCVG